MYRFFFKIKFCRGVYKETSYKEGPLCSLAGRLCIDDLSNEDFGCQVSCEGLYGDVTKHDVVQSEQYKKIEEEYRNYRKIYFKNIQFNSSAPNFYGKYWAN